MLVYSITSRSSFEEAGVMHDWITRIRDQEMPVVSAILAGQAVCVCVCVVAIALHWAAPPLFFPASCVHMIITSLPF